MEKVGPVLASGLGTAIATRSPWGFVVGVIWGAMFESLGKGLEEGDWSNFITEATGSLGVILAKIAPKLGLASAGGPATWVGAIGSIVSDLIFGSIIQNLRDSGDDQTADMLDSIDGAVSGALGGAGLGATIGSIFPGIGTAIGAIAGAIIGALVGALSDNWDKISVWWNEEAVPWFKSLPGKVAKFFVNAGTWLYTAGTNLIQGLKNGVSTWWSNVTTWFSGLPQRIMSYFSNAGQWLWNAGQNILNGLLGGMQQAWNDITSFVGGIGGWIAANKGPESYDKKLLIPNGSWIMEGLGTGLATEFQQVLAQVRSFGPQMETAFATPQLNISRVSAPTAMPALAPIQQIETVTNPYVNNQTSDDSQRPILYVGTLIADKQSLRELQKKLDVVKSEQDRYR